MWIGLRLSGVCFVIFAATSTAASTYVIRPDGTGDFETIQLVIDAAVDGDAIELTNGTFQGEGNRDIAWNGKTLTVRSQSGNPEGCIPDCEGSVTEPRRGFDIVSVGDTPGVIGSNPSGGRSPSMKTEGAPPC